MPTTERQEQVIEQVAASIYGASLTAEAAAAINGGEGWSFQVRWHDGDYVNMTDFTQCSEYKLSAKDLAAAIAMAAAWEKGDFADTYVQARYGHIVGTQIKSPEA